MTQKIDVLAFGPHPDDAEIGTGGTLLCLKSDGYSTGIIDMTRGEMASGGTVEVRDRESKRAAEILKVDIRENLGLPDCGVEDNHENRLKVAAVIRKYQPSAILVSYFDLPPGRGLGHTDHIATGTLVSHANNFAHLKNLPIEGEPWYAPAVFYYFLPADVKPTFIIDVTEFFDEWLKSILAHESQFGGPDRNVQVREFFEGRARMWGRFVGAKYAQGFFSVSPLLIGDLMSLVPGFAPLRKEESE